MSEKDFDQGSVFSPSPAGGHGSQRKPASATEAYLLHRVEQEIRRIEEAGRRATAAVESARAQGEQQIERTARIQQGRWKEIQDEVIDALTEFRKLVLLLAGITILTFVIVVVHLVYPLLSSGASAPLPTATPTPTRQPPTQPGIIQATPTPAPETPTPTPTPTSSPSPTPTPPLSVEPTSPYLGAWNTVAITNTSRTTITLKAEGAQLSLTPPKAGQKMGSTEIQLPPGTGTLYVLPSENEVKLSYQDSTGQQFHSFRVIQAQVLETKPQIDLASPPYLFDTQQLSGIPDWAQQFPITLTVRVSLTPTQSAPISIPVTITVTAGMTATVEATSTPTVTTEVTPPVKVEPTSLLLAGGEPQEVVISLPSATDRNPPAYEIVDLLVTTAGGEEARVPIVLVHGLKKGESTSQLFEKRGDDEPVITRSGKGFPGWVAEREDDPWRLWLIDMVALGTQANTARCTKGKGEMRLGAQETQWCYIAPPTYIPFDLVPKQLTLKCLAEPDQNQNGCVVALWDKKEEKQQQSGQEASTGGQ